MQPAELADWWKQFHDPVLDQLIGQSIAGNLMLRQAQAHIRQARFERQIVAANLYPAAAATASYEHLRFSKNGLGASAVAATNPSGATGGGAAGGATGGSGRGSSPNFNLFQAGFDASWELDVFGGIRRAVEAADANIGSSIEDQRDVLVSLLGEVALNYVQLRGFQRQIAIAQENLETQRQTLALTQLRLDGGIATELDVDQAAAQVAATESTIQPLETSARQAIHLLGVLTGREPMALVELLAPTSPIPAAPPEIPLGLPSDLLNQRADVRRAERQLASATAQIGVAVAQLYPSFSLMGNFGWQSTHLHNLFSSNSIAWSASPQVSVPIFQGGALRANIRLHTAIQEQAASAYEQAVLTALKDVEDALVAYANEQEHLQKLADAVAANEKTLALAKLLFDQGRTDFLNVLDAQRSLFIAQDAQVRSQSALSTDVVTLYKALGGGWEAVRQE
jgi:NodT family efflux transporter outer membrane factor (OMF) lipoprotein